MLKKSVLKVMIIFFSILLIGCFSFLSEKKYQNTLAINTNNLVQYNTITKPKQVVNKSNVTNNTDKRILLEAAHGNGLGSGECNHESVTVSNKRYYENLEAREMINLIAGYLNEANIKYEISNEIAGDSYFNGNYTEGSCNPDSSECCGFIQGTIGSYSRAYTYPHIDQVGTDKYLFAFELHFNGGGGKYSMVMVDDKSEPTNSNAQKILDAVDSVIGTTNSQVKTDTEGYGKTLGAISNLARSRHIPTYYLETFFMDYTPHMQKYLESKEELAQKIAQALAQIAGEDGEISEKGLLKDYFTEFPTLITGNDFTCRAILVDKTTGELNDLGKIVKGLFNIIKIAAPLIAIVLSIIDFIKCIINSDVNGSIKKAGKRTVIRVAIAILIFLLPYLLEFLFHLFGLYDISNCGIT